MKRILLITILISSTCIAFAQQKKEGAHQAEMNTKQNDRDRRDNSKEEMTDSRDVSVDNGENIEGDTTSSEPNTPAVTVSTTNAGSSPGYQMDEGIDGTNTRSEATLNIAGSPIPGGKAKASPSTVGSTKKSTKDEATSSAKGSTKKGDKKESKSDGNDTKKKKRK